MPRLFENSWKIVNLAASASLILCDVEFFNSELYNAYKCTGYRGLSKRFDTEGAVTHFFCRGQTVLVPVDNFGIHSLSNNIKNFIQVIKYVFECLSKKVSLPYSKIVFDLENVASSSFISLDKILISDLIFCKNIVLPFVSVSQNEEPSNCDNISICDMFLARTEYGLLIVSVHDANSQTWPKTLSTVADYKLNCLNQAQAGSFTMMCTATSGHETLLTQHERRLRVEFVVEMKTRGNAL
ncbi:hypothetical protein AVEN_94963-1 [Araneus ventricosus]|uniref:Uncharacterized protein n=1 Tax=Araneus ventricosus TaxID=182803 RepID=A0A4Y2DI72_ARAVE|nr:hypothetical protein AVEN_94963-1 [Araneus ventricosus]